MTEEKMRAALEAVMNDITQCSDYKISDKTYELVDEALKPKVSLTQHILELPGQIKSQSLRIADVSLEAENLRADLADMKNNALELVLSTTENGKPKFSNDQSRKLAQEQILKSDEKYRKALDELNLKERTLRVEQTHLDYLHNLFRAYQSVAAIMGWG